MILAQKQNNHVYQFDYHESSKLILFCTGGLKEKVMSNGKFQLMIQMAVNVQGHKHKQGLLKSHICWGIKKYVSIQYGKPF